MNNPNDEVMPRVHAKLRAQIVPARTLTLANKVRMFELMQRYYDRVTREQFLKDLSKKHDVILLFDERDGQLQGFSTLMKLGLEQNGEECWAIFSGDTVVEKSFWGQRETEKFAE